MMGPQTILCATDFTDASDEALRQAAELASRKGARLVALHCVPLAAAIPPASFAEVPPPVMDTDELVALAHHDLERQLARVPAAQAAARELERATGPIHLDIAEKARAIGADVLVVGSHRHSTVERILLGSVAEAVVRHAPCPVLVARPGAGARKVIAAVDLSEASGDALRLADIEASERGSALVVVHCLDLPPEGVGLGGTAVPPAAGEHPDSRAAHRREARERATAFLAEMGVEANIVIEDGAPAHCIIALAEQLRPELVVVGSTGKSGLRRALLGSVAGNVARKAPCSVLAARSTLHAEDRVAAPASGTRGPAVSSPARQ